MGNVVLIGFMGCGKSSVAVKLSYRMKRQMTDTDKWIEKKEGKTVKEIFEQDGEEAFRRMETECLKQLKETAKNQIISVGGGTPVREENRALLKEIGKVVYLRAKAETLCGRLKDDTRRPVLAGEGELSERIEKLLEERKEAYEAAADLIVDVDDKPFGQVLFEIERGVRPPYRAQGGNDQTGRFGAKGFGEGGYRSGSRTGAGYQTRYPFGQRLIRTYSSAGNPADASQNGEAAAQNAADNARPYSMHRENVQSALEMQNTREQAAGRTAQGERQLRKLLVINGPNINFLGIREKGIYGTQDYNDLLNMIAEKGVESYAAVTVFQSNHEGAIIDRIQEAYFDRTEAIIINPGAYTHYSYAIRDALASVSVPKVEVHISNIMEREEFRRVSVTAPVCDKQIYGHGLEGYLEAIDFALEKLGE